MVADRVQQDLKLAVRGLAAAPGFTATAVATLAIGIGATVAIFTVVNAILLRPLPVRDPDRLVIVGAQEVKGRGRVGASWTKYQLVRDASHVFSGLGAYIGREFTIDPGDAPSQVVGARVTAGFFDALGVAPAIGRTFAAPEDVEGAAPVAIITDALWQRLGGDPALVGRSIRIEGRDTAIVGVLPRGFRFDFADREPQVYLTSVFTPGALTAAQIVNGAGFLAYVARLAPGVTIDQARADLAALDEQYRRDHGSFVDATKYALYVVPFVDNLVGQVRPALLVLMGAVSLLLLIACGNVAHLMLARAAMRRRELAVRLALGASRGRVVQQSLTESLLLAIGGGAFGVLAARAAVDLLVARGPANIPRLADASPDRLVLAFAVGVAGLTAIIFGVGPALRASGVPAGDALKDGRAGGLSSRAAGRLHQWLAISQSAITIALLVGAGLLFESLVRLQAVDPGFSPRQVYTAQIALPRQKYAEPQQREAFFTDLLHDLQSRPGLSTVGATSYLPMSGSNFGFFFFIEGQPHLGPGRDSPIAARHVSADYFRAMRIPLRGGRFFTDADTSASRPVAIINERAARRYFAGVDPIGRRLANSGDGVLREIVGVVGDVRFDGPARETFEELYLPYRQVPWPSMSLVVSSALSADTVAGELRRAVARLDRDQATTEIRPLQRLVDASTTQQQFTSSLVGTFALLATTLAAIGLYGVIALFVSQRRHEIGIRMALGARAADVVRLVMGHGAKLLVIGTVAGLLCAVALSRLLSSLLFGVSATQPLAYIGGAALLVLIGLAACYLPARRATIVDPMIALRTE